MPWSVLHFWVRTLRSGMSQTEPDNARVSDRVWFWKINGLSVVLALLSLLIFYLARSRPN